MCPECEIDGGHRQGCSASKKKGQFKKREVGDHVEVRVYWSKARLQGEGRWHHAIVSKVFTDGSIFIKSKWNHDSVAGEYLGPGRYRQRRFGRLDVRTPKKRKTTGKVRGSGAPGGWVWR